MRNRCQHATDTTDRSATIACHPRQHVVHPARIKNQFTSRTSCVLRPKNVIKWPSRVVDAKKQLIRNRNPTPTPTPPPVKVGQPPPHLSNMLHLPRKCQRDCIIESLPKSHTISTNTVPLKTTRHMLAKKCDFQIQLRLKHNSWLNHDIDSSERFWIQILLLFKRFKSFCKVYWKTSKCVVEILNSQFWVAKKDFDIPYETTNILTFSI